MGTGSNIKTGGGFGRTFTNSAINGNQLGNYYNRNQDIFDYGVVVEVFSDYSILYRPLKESLNTYKFGTAYPFDKNNNNIEVGNVVPLIASPTKDASEDVLKSNDAQVLYLNPTSINQNANDNTTTRDAWNGSDDTNNATLASIADYQEKANKLTGAKASASELIKTVYLPAWEKANNAGSFGKTLSNGLKILMAAQTDLEGFGPNDLNYTTNNPGNVGTCTDCNPKKITKYKTMEEGIVAQWSKVLGPALNTNTREEIGKSGKSKYYYKDFTLLEYLYTYAPPLYKEGGVFKQSTNNPLIYTNYVIGFFKSNNLEINASITLEEISKLN